MALALHLSRLPAPGPRPHHRRVARAILDDAARRHEGQLFVLTNGDLVLLCRSARAGAAGAPAAGAPDPAALPDTLARLLRMDMPDPGRLTTVWKLDEALPALAAFAAERLAEGGRTLIAAPAPGPGLAMQTGVVHALAAIAEGPATADLLRRQTGVLVAAHPPAGGPLLRPLFQEVTFSIAALEARIAAGGQAGADPFLFRHLAGRLDRRMLARLTEAAGTGGVLDIAAGAYGTAPLHINLTLPVILSDAFARFARLCRDCAAPLGVEVALVEACDDAAAFAPRPPRAGRVRADSGARRRVPPGARAGAALRVAPRPGEARLVAPRWPSWRRGAAAGGRRAGADRRAPRGAASRRNRGGAALGHGARHPPLPGPPCRRHPGGGAHAALSARRRLHAAPVQASGRRPPARPAGPAAARRACWTARRRRRAGPAACRGVAPGRRRMSVAAPAGRPGGRALSADAESLRALVRECVERRHRPPGAAAAPVAACPRTWRARTTCAWPARRSTR